MHYDEQTEFLAGELDEEPLCEERKWSPWKVAIGILLFSGAFWIGVYYLVTVVF